MGRREKPVDHSRPARGQLAEHLRSLRKSAGMTYETLAARTGLSPATLKRAACGTSVPRRATVEAYVDGCSGGREAVRATDELWRLARIEERGRLTQLHAPRPELISDDGDLSRALEMVFEQAGAPSLREIRDRSGDPLALPVSSAARIVNRDTIPADQQQLQAFLTGCGVPPERHTPWLAAFTKISSHSPAAPADTQTEARNGLRRQAVLRRLQRSTSQSVPRGQVSRGGGTQWKHFLSLLEPVTMEQIVASGVQSYLGAHATRNGKSALDLTSWQPDYLLEHDGKHLVLEFKSASRPPGPPAAGGTAGSAPRRPSGGSGPAARRERGTAAPARRISSAH
ncbi:helix-turn-helix domain-containing protein [Streptomyces chartreusis]